MDLCSRHGEEGVGGRGVVSVHVRNGIRVVYHSGESGEKVSML